MKFGLILPDAALARYYEEGASLTSQNKLNMRTMMSGDKTLASVRRALLQLDIAEKSTLPQAGHQPSRSYAAITDDDEIAGGADEYECEICGIYEADFDEDELNVILVSLDDQDVSA